MTADEPNPDSDVPKNPRRPIRIPPYVGQKGDGASVPGAETAEEPEEPETEPEPEPEPDAVVVAEIPPLPETTILLPPFLAETEPRTGSGSRPAGRPGAELVLRPAYQPIRSTVVPATATSLRRSRHLTLLVLSTAAALSVVMAVIVAYEATEGRSSAKARALPPPTATAAGSASTAPGWIPVSASTLPVNVAGSTSSRPTATEARVVPVVGRTSTRTYSPKPAPTTAPTTAAARTGLARGRTYSFESVDAYGQYWYFQQSLGYLASAGNLQGYGGGGYPGYGQEAAFTLVAGLADSGCFSFRTRDGEYLRHQNFRLKQMPYDGSDLFRNDATFCPRPGSAGGSYAFQSVNYPDRYLRHRGNELWLDPDDGTSSFRADASFLGVDPVAQ